MAEAACAGRTDVEFFPAHGARPVAAKALCASCPVKEPCAAYAVEHGCDGVWGGTTARERRSGAVARGLSA